LHFTTLPAHLNQAVAASPLKTQKIPGCKYGYTAFSCQWSKHTISEFFVDKPFDWKYLPETSAVSLCSYHIVAWLLTADRGLWGFLSIITQTKWWL
jgi:hypothetical protein